MSKFIDRLKQVSQPPPPPLGFRSAKADTLRPKIQLVALTEVKISAEKLNPADAVIATDIKTTPAAGIWGARLDSRRDMDTLLPAGADFVVLPMESGVISAEIKTGKVLELNSSLTDVLLRTVNDLPVDAVLLTEDGTELTWQKLMLFQRFAGLLTKPVLVFVSSTATAEELQLTWETGVSGVIVKISSEKEAVSLSALREKIDGLAFPSRRKKEKIAPVLPHQTPKVEEEADEGDDDDGDD